MTEFETMKENVQYELETVEACIRDIQSDNYEMDKPTIKKVRQALIDAKAYFEAMIDEIDE